MHSNKINNKNSDKKIAEKIFQCPICKMEVSENTMIPTIEYLDTVYWFCSKSCRDRFVGAPEIYAK